MIKSVWVKNPNGDKLDLNMRSSGDDHGLLVFNLTGLGSAVGTPNGTGGPTYPGVRVNSVKVDSRQVVLTLAVTRFGPLEESTRNTIYKYFPAHQRVTFGVVTDSAELSGTAIVKSVEMNHFAKVENAVIALEFPFPYLADTSKREYSVNSDGAIPLFSFPFSNEGTIPTIEFGILTTISSTTIAYTGGVSTGCSINMLFSGAVAELFITNTNGPQTMTFNVDRIASIVGSGLQSGDILSVNTRIGSKWVRLLRGGESHNLLGIVPWTTTWLKINPGTNILTVDAGGDESLIDVDISFNPLRDGV